MRLSYSGCEASRGVESQTETPGVSLPHITTLAFLKVNELTPSMDSWAAALLIRQAVSMDVHSSFPHEAPR